MCTLAVVGLMNSAAPISVLLRPEATNDSPARMPA